MPRRKRDPKLLREQCSRVVAVLSLTNESDAAISRHLGHANPSTLTRVRDGESFLDSESLARLGRYDVRAVGHPNLHWVLTGDGQPLVPASKGQQEQLGALCTVALREAKRPTRR